MTGVPGQPALVSRVKDRRPRVGHARARKIPAQLVEDEEYQLRHERVAGIDIAKAKADVRARLPPDREGGRRGSRVEDVGATAREILALAGRLLADRVQLVVMEATSDYWRIWYYLLETAGLNVQLVNPSQARQLAGRPKTDRAEARRIVPLGEKRHRSPPVALAGAAAGGPAEDRPPRRAVDRPARGDGAAAPVVRAAAGDPGAAGPGPHEAAAGGGPGTGV